ncbi:formylglycine-generating enzyme family protein [Candidatus Entotheonella palauensis]|uniref:formylglycine-generating enzyme family protein n=1 Tax=Candidatus Entotheonella palauensis TaxID=93172 RepID=UPI000B7D561B|nr:SUMF1/EgtB/PvdO family nonheme iron enzyme [Candidatus Entotheonella palauensis]
MVRVVQQVGMVFVVGIMLGVVLSAQAATSFGLPECAASFSGEAVFNSEILDGMLAEVESSGARPNRENAMLFIVVKHYLTREKGLLVLSRAEPEQPPVLLREDCLPYSSSAMTARTALGDLTADQKKALIDAYDRVDPSLGTAARAGATAPIPADTGMGMKADEPAVKVPTYAMDIYEVTNAQFRKFIEDDGYASEVHWSEAGWQWVQNRERRQPSYWDNETVNQPNQPVVGVTWYEAEAYCRWTGKELPTDAQWGKACRGTDDRPYPWGDQPLENEGEKMAGKSEDIQTAVVGSAPQTQSPYGIHDLAGSVLEWTATETTDRGFVLRGGSGPATSEHVGCNVSHTLLPSVTANFIGFRCRQAGADAQTASQ